MHLVCFKIFINFINRDNNSRMESFHFLVPLIITYTFLPADCGTLPQPANGMVRQNGKLQGSVANYTCDTGYGLVGSSPRVCQDDGTWSGSASCQGMSMVCTSS